jgi:hypothetical protein
MEWLDFVMRFGFIGIMPKNVDMNLSLLQMNLRALLLNLVITVVSRHLEFLRL